MYYLKSRFYQPQWGRFLNADMLFDTGTGLLGTNMFAYCDNNPVNKVDITGMWGKAVHVGYGADLLERRGINFGTYTWAKEMGFTGVDNDGKEYAKIIADGNYAADDFWTKGAMVAGFLAITGLTAFLFQTDYRMSWHMNNTYSYIEVLLADAREWRALGRLIDEVEPNIGLVSKNSAEYHLGYALHPIQDMTGHNDDYVVYGRQGNALLSGSGWFSIGVNIWHHNNNYLYDPTKYADKMDSYFEKHGITYYHWDDVMLARDLSYNMMGRFYLECKIRKLM